MAIKEKEIAKADLGVVALGKKVVIVPTHVVACEMMHQFLKRAKKGASKPW